MYHLSKESKRASELAGLRRHGKLPRRCPLCGSELLWEQDQAGLYVAMDYDSEPHKPHVLTCQNPVKFA
jgi:hypothetical protein